MMNDVESLPGIEATRLFQSDPLPTEIVETNAAFALLRLSRQVRPNHTGYLTAVPGDRGFDLRSVQRMRDDPDVVMMAEVPRPVPRDPGLGTLAWPEGMAYQQDLQSVPGLSKCCCIRHRFANRPLRYGTHLEGDYAAPVLLLRSAYGKIDLRRD